MRNQSFAVDGLGLLRQLGSFLGTLFDRAALALFGGSVPGLLPAVAGGAWPALATATPWAPSLVLFAKKGDDDEGEGSPAAKGATGRSGKGSERTSDAEEESEDSEGGETKLDDANQKRIEAKAKELTNRRLSQILDKFQRRGVLKKGAKLESLLDVLDERGKKSAELEDELEDLRARLEATGKPTRKGKAAADDEDDEEGGETRPAKGSKSEDEPQSQATYRKLYEKKLAKRDEVHKAEVAKREDRIADLTSIIDTHIVGAAYRDAAQKVGMDSELAVVTLLSRSPKVRRAFPYIVKPSPDEPGEVILFEDDGETEAKDGDGDRLTLVAAMAELRGDPTFERLFGSGVIPGSGGEESARPGTKATGGKGTGAAKPRRALSSLEKIGKGVNRRFFGGQTGKK